jgi:hypothetical protein
MNANQVPSNTGQPDQRVCTAEREPWVTPEAKELPRLTDLTLQTGSPIPGLGNPGDGSTVF